MKKTPIFLDAPLRPVPVMGTNPCWLLRVCDRHSRFRTENRPLLHYYRTHGAKLQRALDGHAKKQMYVKTAEFGICILPAPTSSS